MLIAILLIALLMPVLGSICMVVKRGYDRVETQIEATEQVQLFLTQLREDVAKSISIQLQGSSAIHLVQYDGKTVDLYYNPLPSAKHIVRLVNGRGGEIACFYVNHLTFQIIGKKELHISLEMTTTGPGSHFEDSFISFLLT
jgi:hypothetical protein